MSLRGTSHFVNASAGPQPMGICLINTLGGYTPPLDPSREKQLRTLSQAAEVYVLTWASGLKPSAVSISPNLHFWLVPKLSTTLLRYLGAITVFPVAGLILCLRKNCRIFTFGGPASTGFGATLMKLVARWMNRKIVLIFDCQGNFEAFSPLRAVNREDAIGKALRWLKRVATGFTLHRSDIFRAISQATAAQLQRWEPTKPLFIFPGWTDVEAFLSPADIKDTPPIRGNARSQVILYAGGGVLPVKGVHTLVQALVRLAKKYPEISLWIFGGLSDRKYYSSLRAILREHEMEERVWFAGRLPQVEFARKLRQAYVVVLPSFSEGLGRVLLEAMLCKKPVIASDIEAIREIVFERKNGLLVPPGDAEALANSIEWVLEHPQEAREMGEWGYAFARQYLSSEHYLENYRRMLVQAQRLLSH